MSLHGDTMGHGFKPLVSKIRCWNPNKGGYTNKNYNYMHYIATREGVDLSQINRIEDMVNVNADLNDYGEDLIGKEADNSTYLKYITNRPRSHGLFGNIDTDNFSEVSKKLNEVTKQDRIIFRGIISLSKEDAEALEYTSAEKWNTYLRSVMPDIAKELSVSPNNMTWVAAFHAEANHPHVHYMLWDNRDKVMSPYIHVSRQEACRKICQDAMFTPENEALIRSITEAERKELYMQQNVARNEITSFLKEMYQGDNVPGVVKEILPERTSPEDHKRLNRLYEKILNTMPGSGRIAYKFMPPECKGYIDKVTDILLKRPDIGGQYDVYMKAVGDIHRVLGKTSREISKEMTSAKEDLYNRTGNIILQSVCCLKEQILGDKESVYADFIYPDPEEAENIDLTDSNENDFEEDYDDSEEEKDNPLKEEKKFREIVNNSSSDKIIQKALNSLARLYTNAGSTLYDYNKALSCLNESVAISKNFDAYTMLGGIYSDKNDKFYDPEKAELYYKWAINQNPNRSNFVKLRLSRLYADNESVLCDYEEALEVLNGASDTKGSVSLQQGNIYNNSNYAGYDKKTAYECYEKAAHNGNAYGMFQKGSMLIDDRNTFYNLGEGVKELEKSIQLGKEPRYPGDTKQPEFVAAHIKLAGLYLNKNYEVYNVELAEQHLKEALGDIQHRLQKKYTRKTERDISSLESIYLNLGKCALEKDDPQTAKEFFTKCIQESQSGEIRDNWYTEEARIALSEVYLEEQDYDAALKVLTEPEQKDEKGRIAIQEAKIHLSLGDIPEAMRYYDKAVEKGNLTGRYYQSKIYSTNDYGVYDITKALLYMREAAEADIFVAKAGVAKLYLREDAYNPKLAYDQLHRVLAEFQTKELCNDLSKSELRQRASIYEILGDLHKDKNCIYYDCEKSVEYYNKALVDNQDAVTARLSMAKIYSDVQNQENGHYNLSFAMKQLQLLETLNNKDIDRNYDRIQMAISHIYADKNYEGCDYGKALSALDKIQSDEKGFIDLQRGNIYAVENSPYYDMKKAVACYTSAAQKNNTNAMVKLAKCYLYGLGVDRDKEAAKLWLQEADRQGDEYAREYLKNIDRTSYNPITYTLVKQLLNSLAQSKDKKVQQLREQEFKSQSKQAKKEQYLHRN